MQRVLSFQMARGFGESSEFITKRMCFSFLFSVGFLCLLCGFLTGRFAAGRAVDSRAEKTRLQLAGNGLESNEYLRGFLVEKIHKNSFTTNYSTYGLLKPFKTPFFNFQKIFIFVVCRLCFLSSRQRPPG